jgi:hypothetical protein
MRSLTCPFHTAYRPDGSEGILFHVISINLLAMDTYHSIIGFCIHLVTGSATFKPKPLDEPERQHFHH